MNLNTSILMLPLMLEEQSGIIRHEEPITVGIPLPLGIVFASTDLRLIDQKNRATPLQTQVLARWFDGSVKWILLDFQASVAAHGKAVFYLLTLSKHMQEPPYQSLSVRQTAGAVTVDTGQMVFVMGRHVCKPFDRVVVQGTDMLEAGGSHLVLTDGAGRQYQPYIHDITVETVGPLRVTMKLQGEWRGASPSALARFIIRLSFYAGSNVVALQVTLHNPRAARHRGGLWDLGDESSVYFKDLSLHVPLCTKRDPRIVWTTQPDRSLEEQDGLHLEIYQDSSGGENWYSSNHVNRFGEVKHTFQGYRVTAENGVVRKGKRATPMLAIHDGEKGIAAAIDQFWQNFPKALEAHHHRLTLRLFPKQYNDVYELQGGEQKTHTVYLQFASFGAPWPALGWVHDRLVPQTMPEWYTSSKAFSYLTPRSQDQHNDCQSWVDTAVAGPRSFFARREIIDEYGWRHFGDLYADHEAVDHAGETPLVSHYNNQYDVVYGAIIQYVRSGDRRWFDLMRDLAKHVIDIDIYHTHEDRPEYNGGLFWHTDHFADAATATHRTHSKVTKEMNKLADYGGGPSNEHNYTTGLLHYYFLTGDPLASEAVQTLADWVINMDNGSSRLLGRIDKRPTGACSSTVSRDYHGPGRGSGNSLNALLDAYLLTRGAPYLAKAEQLIRRCIHPADDLHERQLDDVEHRWSYTVFLQVLGKYLDLKVEMDDLDDMYSYARASLLHYATWMLEHEVPSTCVLDRVEIPSSTWPAQDIRKSNVLYLAAKHATEALHSAFRQKADFFFRTCIQDLRSFPTHTLTRPVAIMMSHAHISSYFQSHPEELAPQPRQICDFGQPQRFTPQLSELYKIRDRLKVCLQMMQAVRRPLLAVLRFGKTILLHPEHHADFHEKR